MAEKIEEATSDTVTSNKHLTQPSSPEPWTGTPGAGRPDGPSDDGSSGGPTVGGGWGGMQADGAGNTSADEMAVVEEASRRVPGEILDSAPP